MRTPAVINFQAWNNEPFVRRIRFTNRTLGPSDLLMQVRLYPGQPGPPVINLVNVVAGDQGVSIANEEGAGGSTDTVLTIYIIPTTFLADSFPKPGEAGDDVILHYDLMNTKAGELTEMLMRGTFTVKQGVSRG